MRFLLVTSSIALLVACSSAGGGADILNAGGAGGFAGGASVGGAGAKAGNGGAGGDEDEQPPPEEENQAGAGGGGGTDPGAGGSDAGGASGSASGGASGAGGTTGTGGSGGSPDGSGADCNAEDGWPAESRTFECEVLDLVNAQRAAGATCGGVPFDPVPALTMHPILRGTARAHAKDMADNDYFDHQSKDGKSSGDRMKAAGYEGSYYGENIAKGQKDPAAAMASWMKSSAHCKGIMAGKYKHLGVGFAASGSDTYWVQNFGAP